MSCMNKVESKELTMPSAVASQGSSAIAASLIVYRQALLHLNTLLFCNIRHDCDPCLFLVISLTTSFLDIAFY